MEKNENEKMAEKIMMPIINATESKEYLLSPIGQQLKKFELQQRQAQVYVSSTIVPESYRGIQNIGNVIIGIDMAERLHMNPLQVFQNLYVVHGNPGWSSKFLIASFNTCGRYTPITYIETGKRGTDSWGMIACTKSKETGEEIKGIEITIGLAKSEGWYNKPGSKWKTIPELMLRYRAAAWMINTTAPEISMGISTVEEIQDSSNIVDAEYEEIPIRKVAFNQQPEIEHSETEKQNVEDGNIASDKVPADDGSPKEKVASKKRTAEDLFGNKEGE